MSLANRLAKLEAAILPKGVCPVCGFAPDDITTMVVGCGDPECSHETAPPSGPLCPACGQPAGIRIAECERRSAKQE